MLSSPATQRRKPNTPVITLPYTNVLLSHSTELERSANVPISPFKRMKGATITAEPKFVQYANSIVELLQWGREALISTA